MHGVPIKDMSFSRILAHLIFFILGTFDFLHFGRIWAVREHGNGREEAEGDGDQAPACEGVGGGIEVDQLFFRDPDGFMIEICNCDSLPVVPLAGELARSCSVVKLQMLSSQINQVVQP